MRHYIILIFISLVTLITYGQNYELKVTGTLTAINTPSNLSEGQAYIFRNGIPLKSYSSNVPLSGLSTNTIDESIFIDGFNLLQLRETSLVYANGIFDPPFCETNSQSPTQNEPQAIEQSSLNVNGCPGNNLQVIVIPRVGTINLGNGIESELCIGNQLIINAPPGFPNVAYNWQFSVNGGSNWIDFPSGINKTSSIAATIEEIIGSNHRDYLNQNILFRVGSSLKGIYSSNTKSILYSPCAPLITDLNYIPPNCNGEAINLIITFDRSLESGETFSQISIIDADNGIQSGQLTDVPNNEYPVVGNTFTFSNVNGLEDSHSYFIRYQMKRNNVLVPGFVSSTETFTYIDIPPLKYNIDIESEITCNSADDGKLRITIDNNNEGAIGTPPYSYILSDGTTGTFSGASTTISGLSAGSTTIQVFDSNACTERQ